MSDHYHHFIPTDPEYLPTDVAQEGVRALLKAIFPRASEITVMVHDSIEFVCAVQNFESVSCPKCKAEIDNDWWGQAMDAAYESAFQNLSVTTPCCRMTVSLNELDYDMPQGFARFVASVLEGESEPSAEEIRQLEISVGSPLRLIHARY